MSEQKKALPNSLDELKDILFMAFKAGENWGVTYSTWFIPDEGDDKKKFEEWIKSVI